MSYTRLAAVRQLSHFAKFYGNLEVSSHSTISVRKHVTLQKNNSDSYRCCPVEQSKFFSTESSEKIEKDGYFKKIMKTALAPQLKRTRTKISGYMHYENVADVIDYGEWFKRYNMSDTFMSWFLITELHIWMLMVRCMAEGNDGRFLRNTVVESLWNDVSLRATKFGVGSSKKRESLDVLSEQFQGALIAYDEGLLSNDMVLAGAVWRRLFAMNSDNAVDIENVVRYIRKSVLVLDDIPKEEFFDFHKKSVVWLPLEKM